MAAEQRRTPDLELPKRVGRYEAFLQIGAGGMARVYLAVQRGQGGQHQVVVVKVLRREAVEDEHVLALFMDEARIAMRLHHPNVIRTREVIAEPPDYLLAMDFQSGQSLLQVLRRLGRLAVPLDEHIYILTKVLAGLGYAHELKDENGQPFGIVHRDVSPANVLVSYTGEVKLLDFGIAKATGALAATQDGVVKGKLGYAAPEQCLGKPADRRSDVYAVGVMLWEAIAGRRRASGETWHSVLQARLDDAEPALEEVCPDAPEALLEIARKALGHEPEARYATAKDFQRDLDGYLAARKVKIGPGRIAAMVGPHFEQDRADQRQAIEAFLTSLRSGASGQRRRVPLPAPILHPELDEGEEEEDTSRIPVDDALLMKSRRGSMMPPANAAPSTPPVPVPSAPPLPAMQVPELPVSGTTTLPSGIAPGPPPLASASRPPSSAAPAPTSSRAVPTSSRTPPTLPETTQANSDAIELVQDVRPASARFTMPGALEAVFVEKKSRGRGPVLAAGAAVVVLVALGVVLGHRSGKESASSSPVPGAVVTDHAASPQTGVAGATTSTEVRVRIEVEPADAELRLDGRLLPGNPFLAVFPREGNIHELSATADGYRDEKQVVQFNRDVDVKITLRRQKGATHAVIGRAAAPSAARPSPDTHPTATSVEPGMDLQGRPDNRSRRNIDEKDPYSQ